MEISYLVGIATRGFNTEFQLKEVRWEWGRVLINKIVWCKKQAPIVQKVDNAIHWIDRYPLDSAIVCPNSYLLDSDLSGTLFQAFRL